MPTITIYLTNELYDRVKNSPSKTVRTALEHYYKDEDDEAVEGSEQQQLPPREPNKSGEPAANE